MSQSTRAHLYITEEDEGEEKEKEKEEDEQDQEEKEEEQLVRFYLMCGCLMWRWREHLVLQDLNSPFLYKSSSCFIFIGWHHLSARPRTLWPLGERGQQEVWC